MSTCAMYVPCTDGSVDCKYYGDTQSKTTPYVIVIATSLAVASVILIIITLLYLLYCRHSKRKSSNFVQFNNDDDDSCNDNTTTNHDNQATVQPLQEASSLINQEQVGIPLTTPTESSQSQYSKSKTDLLNKKLENHYYYYPSVSVAESSKVKSSLVGIQNRHSNLFETVA